MIDREELQEKEAILANAANILKSKFVGLDDIVDEVIDLIRPWFIFPELQEKPVVCSLWGLTGTGKTDFLRVLSESIGFQDKYWHFDMGKIGDRSSWELHSTLEEIFTEENGYPVMLCLDEFQKARTVGEMGGEIEGSGMRLTWELIDSGQIEFDGMYRQRDEYFQLYKLLAYCKTQGIGVENGKVTTGVKRYRELVGLELEDSRQLRHEEENLKKRNPWFIPQGFHSQFYELLIKEYSHLENFKKHISTLGLDESIALVYRAYRECLKPLKIDCSKGLIFVVGNLDEVYNMNGAINPDIDADSFRKETMKITLPKIKKALQRRFKNEQIARLGNYHIIYRSMGQKQFEELIKMTLENASKDFLTKTGIQCTFSKSYLKLIYKEGVYPVQGTRPIFTTIHALFRSYLPKVVLAMTEQNIDANSFHFDFVRKQIVVKHDNHELFKIAPNLKLEPLRKNRKDDLQCNVAIHEAGHGVLSAVLNRIAPKEIRSISTTDGIQGWNLFDNESPYTLKFLRNQIAILYGGIVAEKLVFGDEHVTLGSNNDIAIATQIARDLVLRFGLVDQPVYRAFESVEMKESVLANKDQTRRIEDLLQEGYELAQRTLRREMKFLLELGSYLATHPMVKREQFKKIALQFTGDKVLLEEGFIHEEMEFYKLALERKKAAISEALNTERVGTSSVVYLNKEG